MIQFSAAYLHCAFLKYDFGRFDHLILKSSINFMSQPIKIYIQYKNFIGTDIKMMQVS
jgi:hypothetical protein